MCVCMHAFHYVCNVFLSDVTMDSILFNFFSLFKNSLYFYLCACKYVYIGQWKPEENVSPPWTGVACGCSCWIWVLGMNLDYLGDNQELFNSEPSLQSLQNMNEMTLGASTEWNNELSADTVSVRLWEKGNPQVLSSMRQDSKLCKANLPEQATCHDFMDDTVKSVIYLFFLLSLGRCHLCRSAVLYIMVSEHLIMLLCYFFSSQ